MLSSHYPSAFLRGNPALHLGLGAALSWQDPAAASGESPGCQQQSVGLFSPCSPLGSDLLLGKAFGPAGMRNAELSPSAPSMWNSSSCLAEEQKPGSEVVLGAEAASWGSWRCSLKTHVVLIPFINEVRDTRSRQGVMFAVLHTPAPVN